ncbi:MarR family winged helix-turn-helix transcriptional regulator [Aggregatilinea lenta]|uniref:MarR family winged helix-turn-helix transcriptional regulator n=1 Tax=Aggregatilinea lenta TaxID=913108 RepID=UPI000E5BD7FE|nr:MarR family transcriptional regulator [Aggregatilinea lenta]
MPDVPFRYSSADDSPGFLLWQATNRWQREQRAALEPLNLTHVQYVVLAVGVWLSRRGEAVTQAQIAAEARIDPMMASQVLRTLEDKGLVRRAPHPTDSRAKAVEVTDGGRALAAQATQVVEDVDERFFADAGPNLPVLIAALRRLSRTP